MADLSGFDPNTLTANKLSSFNPNKLSDSSGVFDVAKTIGKAAFDTVEFVARPFNVIGDITLAPIAEAAKSGNLFSIPNDPVQALEHSFSVGFEKASANLGRPFGTPRENFAHTALKDVNIPESLRPTVELALMVISDPTIAVSGGFASTLRKSFELAAKTGEIANPFSTALKEFVSVVPMRPEELTHFTKQAAKADQGDVEATQELLDAFNKRNSILEKKIAERKMAAEKAASGDGLKVELRIEPVNAVAEDAKISDVKAVTAQIEKKDAETLKNASELEDLDKIKLEARVNVMKTFQKEDGKAEKKVLRDATKQATEVIGEHPIFRLIDSIKKDGGVSAEGLTQDTATLLKDSHGLIQKDGKTINEIAHQHGFSDPIRMIESIAKVGSKKQAVDEVAGQIFNVEKKSIDQLSDIDLKGKFLEEEQKLIEKRFGKDTTNIKSVIRKNTRQTRIGNLVSEEEALKASFKKAEQASRIAFREGKSEGIVLVKDKFDAYKDTVKARIGVQKSLATIDKSIRHKSLPVDYMEHLQAILGGLRDIPDRFKAQVPQETFDEFLSVKAAQGDDVATNALKALFDDLPKTTNLKDLTPTELKKFEFFAKAMVGIGLKEKKLIGAASKQDLQETVTGLVNSIYSKLPVRFQSEEARTLLEQKNKMRALSRLSDFAKAYHAENTRPEFIMIALDGEKLDGPVQRIIQRELQKANDTELIEMEAMSSKLNSIFDVFGKGRKRQKWGHEKTTFRLGNGFDWAVTKEQQMMIALNNGNKGNRQALMDGFGISKQDIENIVANLNGKEKNTVNQIWDLTGSFWNKSKDIHLELTGQRLKQVKGHYFALIQDWKLIEQARGKLPFEQKQRDLFSGINPQILPKVPKTAGTQRIARKGGAGAPLLDFTAIDRQLTNVIHDTTHAIAVRDVRKIISHPDFKNAVTDTLGKDMYDQLQSSLLHIAKPTRENLGTLERAARWARSNATAVDLGLRVSVGLKQILSLTQTMKEIGTAPVIKETARLWANPFEFSKMQKFVDEMSPEIKFRSDTFDREILNTSLTFLPKQARDAFFAIIRLGDRMAVYPSYMAAYKKMMKQTNGDMEASRIFAEKIVRITQPINQAKDLAAVARGGELKKTMTMFYSFFSVARNQFARLNRQRRLGMGLTEFTEAYFMMLVMPAVISETVNQRRIPTPKEAAASILGFYVGTFPFVRDAYSIASRGERGTEISPVIDQIKKLADTSGKGAIAVIDTIMGKEPEPPSGKRTIESLGFVTGIPTSQAMIAVDGIDELYKGNSDFLLEPFLGPQKENP